MSNTVKPVSEVIDTEYKEFAMYVLENRAIPSYIDGFKPTSRKIIYSALNHFKGKKVKISELGTSIASVANYHHGEGSAMGAAVTLTAQWNNNVPLLKGQGNFGSRLIQESAAPRYIFANLSDNFYKYFNDFDVVNKHSDIENPEPQQYLPIIPWVLVNGVEGIAVGFACKFLPHDPKEIAKACIKSLSGKLKDDHQIKVKLPGFKGEVIQVEPNKILSRGIVERKSRNTWVISEVPWGYDREKYFNFLDTLLEKHKIKDFEDQCDDSGFKFSIKLDTEMDEECAKDPISYFNLERPYTENYVALDEKGSLILFDTKAQIINRFVDFRLVKVKEQLDVNIVKLNKKIKFYDSKIKFIYDVIEDKDNISKYSKSDLTKRVKDAYGLDDDQTARLVSSPIYDLTLDMVESLLEKLKVAQDELSSLQSTKPEDIYLSMLKSI